MKLIIFALTGLLSLATHLFADYVGSPLGGVTVPSPGPFILPSGDTMRYQQVYGASDFQAIQNGGGLISDLYFHPFKPLGGLFIIITNLQINLSTTAKQPDGLSLTFAQNLGGDDKVVFSGPLQLRTGTGVGDASIGIHLSTPFYYNPNAGNLLLDVRNFGDSGFGPIYGTDLAAENSLGDTVSLVAGQPVGASLAEGSSTYGLVTLFSVTPVPEPNSFLLLILGGFPVWLLARRRGIRKRQTL